MQPKPLFQKKQGIGVTLSVALLNTLDQSRGQIPRSALIETILREHFGLSSLVQGHGQRELQK